MTTVIVPLYRYINNKIKRFLSINELAKLCNWCFSKHDILGTKFIGLDIFKRKLFYIEQNNNKPTCLVINLKDVESCIIKKQYNSINAGALKQRKLNEFLTTIFLQLRFKHNSKLVHLPFFEKKKDKFMNIEELEAKASAWETMVSKLLPINVRERA